MIILVYIVLSLLPAILAYMVFGDVWSTLAAFIIAFFGLCVIRCSNEEQ